MADGLKAVILLTHYKSNVRGERASFPEAEATKMVASKIARWPSTPSAPPVQITRTRRPGAFDPKNDPEPSKGPTKVMASPQPNSDPQKRGTMETQGVTSSSQGSAQQQAATRIRNASSSKGKRKKGTYKDRALRSDRERTK